MPNQPPFAASDQTPSDADGTSDQVASDRDIASGVNARAPEPSGDIHEPAARRREQSAETRLGAADERDEIAHAHDLAALERDQAADARSRALAQRDAACEQDDGAHAATGAEIVIRAAGQRKRAIRQRAQAAEQDARAAEDRRSAADDREQAACERLHALVDREMLARQLAAAMIAPAPPTRTPGKALMTAWLVLMVRDQGDRYGWALVNTLHGHGVAVESGRAYRILRKLDEAGAVSSQWTTSVHGPRRRSYRITPDGRKRLDDLAADIRATWELHDAFLRAYEQPRDEAHAPADDPHGESDDPPQPVEAAPGDTPAHPQLTRELLAAWLLLLIARHASHGYSLRRALQNSDVHPDAGTLYRALRRHEHSGWLESRWMPASAGGPRHRLYRITARGRRNLDDVAHVIATIRDTQATFLLVYDEPAPAKVS